eukprot:6187012-Pleurochrysis_carterae.AAC.1
MPTSRRSAAIERSDSLKASACAAAVQSGGLQVAVGVAAREELDEVLGLQRVGALGDVAVAVVALEQLRAETQPVRDAFRIMLHTNPL